MSTKQNVEIKEKKFKEVEQYLNQKVIGNFEVVTLADILEIYYQSNGKSISSAQIRENINESFADIDSWTPKYGEKFFYNSKVEKGQIIEYFMREIEHLKRKYKKGPTMEEEIEHVASKLREQIQKATEMFDIWPPDEVSILDYPTESPKILVDFITSIVHINSNISESRKNFMSSICQDQMYSFSNGTIKTKKHAYFGLCLKRITGSKECLLWLN